MDIAGRIETHYFSGYILLLLVVFFLQYIAMSRKEERTIGAAVEIVARSQVSLTVNGKLLHHFQSELY